MENSALCMDNIESGKKHMKNTLAVFEHVSCKEKRPGSKIQNLRKFSYKRTLSPVSDSELVIDDDDYTAVQPIKRRNRGVRLIEEPLQLTCGWAECGDTFECYHKFMVHINVHVSKTDDDEHFSCNWENCCAVFPSFTLLRQHVYYHGYHMKLRNIGNNVLERVKLPKCIQTNEFMFPISLSGYTCEWANCGQQFVTIYDYHEHMRLHVNSNPKYCKNGEIIYCCWSVCSFKCSSQYKLSDHLRSHSKERTVACPTCGSMFATKTKFYDHRKRQLPIEMQSYQCSQCSKLFPSERLLRDHMRSHINHYKCTMCDMTCSKPSALATHIRFRHLKERPLKCSLCEHSCVSKQALETHLMTHCSEKLFACEECSFRCRSLNGLDRHYQVVHGQGWSQTYECHCCQKTFSRGNQLTQHLIKKHNFHWPSGHSRFRYKEDTDGIFRLQTVRYESIEVTQEMMRTTSSSQSSEPTINSSFKYNLRKKQQSSDKTSNFVLMITENGEQNVACSTDHNILMTISDIDEKGNVVNSEVLSSNEMKIVDTSESTSDEARQLRSRKTKNDPF